MTRSNTARSRSRRGTGTGKREEPGSSNGRVGGPQQEMGQETAETAGAPQEICGCATRLKAGTALGIMEALARLPIPESPQLVSEANPLGSILNQVRQMQFRLNAQVGLITRLTTFQIGGGLPTDETISCQEVRHLTALLKATVNLTKAWWNALVMIQGGMQAAASEHLPGLGLEDQAKSVDRTLDRMKAAVDRISELGKEVPNMPNIADILSGIFGGESPFGMAAGGGPSGMAVITIGLRPRQPAQPGDGAAAGNGRSDGFRPDA